MPTISEPRDPDILSARYSSLRYWYISGSLGEPTFRASLAILGLRGQDIDAEVALAKMEKKQ